VTTSEAVLLLAQILSVYIHNRLAKAQLQDLVQQYLPAALAPFRRRVETLEEVAGIPVGGRDARA
jgi:hypothetical protein